MALIKCAKCGKKVSDKATKCSSCGAKISKAKVSKEVKTEAVVEAKPVSKPAKKSYNLLCAIGVAYLIAVVLTWFITTGTYSAGTFTDAGKLPVGIINLFRLPVMTFQAFIQYTLVIVAMGIFYGVLNKTGVYTKLVDKCAASWKGKEKFLLVLVTIIFALIGSLTGLSMLAFLLVPFVAGIVIKAGYNKMSALLSTVGALLAGEAASVFGFTGAGYISILFSVSMFDQIITKIILLILLVGLYVFFVFKKAKKGNDEIPFYDEEVKSKKSVLPLAILGVLFLVLCFFGMYDWYYGWGIEFFSNLHDKIMAISIGSYPIMSNLLSGVSALGYWGNYELAIALVIFSLIISWIYGVKAKDLVEGVAKGGKAILPVAIYATLANVVFTIMIANQTNMFGAIVNMFGSIKTTFSLPIVASMSAIGSLFFNDFYYLLSAGAGLFTGYDAIYYPLVGVVTTAIHGLFMMALPTSVALVAGLKLFDVKYTEWFKKIWLYLVEALVVIILVAVIVAIIL